MNLHNTLLATLLTASSLQAAEYHVSTSGIDQNNGSDANPFRTISAAANIAQPGDAITVHEGTYRERINPPRGGSSDSQRITYRAAAGETVVIKGSEMVTGWTQATNGLWSVSLPNSFFGDYNPFNVLIAGDWFWRNDRDHHTGEVYLDGTALYEETSLEKSAERTLSWYCETDEQNTHLWANFADINPNQQLVEVNERPTIFYPSESGRNYITVSGFTLCQAATQWAAPTAEQIAIIGTHWSKGWIIENNVISDSKCVGVTLGKDRASGHNNAESAGGYNEVIKLALANGWNKDQIGSHIVRNNTIHDCGAAGICGSMGGVFSQITGNHIYNIHQNKPFDGAEQAAIKIHAPIDCLIANNRIHHSVRGIWLDWMTQGTRVSANVCYQNGKDLFLEVNHGPCLIDNNLFLSKYSLKDWSEGTAYAHNLFAGEIHIKTVGRKTPYHQPHSTKIAGLSAIAGGDNHYLNNILSGMGLDVYNASKPPMRVDGNVYLNDANPFQEEANLIHKTGFNSNITLVEEPNAVYLEITLPPALAKQKTQRITTELLGTNRITGAAFENSDGSPLTIDTDYFGNKRAPQNPSAGPFENPGSGALKVKVWPVQ